jgi:hypothetical protein
MSREHMPIQIGLPPKSDWRVAGAAPISLVAFVAGEDLPDPGDAFLSAGRAFGGEPTSVEPMPVDDPSIHWAFSFEIAGRGSRILMWCEDAREGESPDGRAPDARFAIAVQTILEPSTVDDFARAQAAKQAVWPASLADFIRLAATAATAAGRDRTRLLFDADLANFYAPDDCARLFLGDAPGQSSPGQSSPGQSSAGRSSPGQSSPGALADERHLYRIELRARGAGAPLWISTVGLARVGKPELEMLEVPHELAEAALQVVDALAARFVSEDLPDAGAPFEAGPALALSLVPANEAAETVPPEVAGSPADRARFGDAPRAAICAAGQRGAFRKAWVPPTDELRDLSRLSTGLYLSRRVIEVRERHARATWADFAAAFAAHGARRSPPTSWFASVARARPDPLVMGEFLREHVNIRVEAATPAGGRGAPLDGTAAFDFSVDDVSDWEAVGVHASDERLGPYEANRLGAR